MASLATICNEWLDNADLDIKFISTGNDIGIKLIFYVAGTGKKVLVICKRIVKFSVDQEPDEAPLYLVLHTEITLKKKESLLNLVHPDMHLGMGDELWHVNIMQGDVRIHVVSETLSWEVLDITPEERKWYTN